MKLFFPPSCLLLFRWLRLRVQSPTTLEALPSLRSAS